VKKPLLGPCDSYQLEPFEYEWAWTMAREQEQNNWAPEEIPVAPDVMLYRGGQCPLPEKHLFESIMAQLTTFDIQRGDDAAETFLQIFQPAEIKHYLKRLIWDEALHTRSYRYIIENLGVDLEIYDRWKTAPAMKARVDYANKVSSEVEKILHDITTERFDLVRHYEYDIPALQTILKSLIFWSLIFEGIWFMLNLKGPLQSLAKRGLFKGAAEQFQYIARDEDSHIRFGHRLTEAFSEQHPECWTEEFKASIIKMFRESISLEEDYIRYCLSMGPVLGYAASDHVETAKFFANLKCRFLGLPDPFVGAKHKMSWMSESMELKKEKNFFECRVTDYRAGGALAWDDNSPLDDITNWNADD
jgi:ribonucleoside-diphosphate reductase beta chain